MSQKAAHKTAMNIRRSAAAPRRMRDGPRAAASSRPPATQARNALDASRQMRPQKSVVTVSNYRDDPLYPRIVRATDAILRCGKVVRPIDILAGMGLLTSAQIENWYAGRVPYLERVIAGNLTRLSRLLRILRFHVHDLNLVPSITSYQRGRRPSSALRFTKTGDAKLERAYSTHFLWPGKKPFHARDQEDGG
jgi:hypothetical protein